MTRLMLVIGAGLATSASLGAAPALATGAAGQTAAAPPAVQVQQPRDDVEGYYRSLRKCERVGREGKWDDEWESYDCEFVRRGPYRGMWRLEVERDWWDGHDGDDDDDHGHGDGHGGGGHGGGHGGGGHGGGHH